MAPTYQNIDRQLGELTADMRALRADQGRHAETTESMRADVVELRVLIEGIRAEKRATAIINKTLMGLGAVIAGAISGMFGSHIGVPPGAH